MCGVVAHFIGCHGHVQAVLLALRCMKGTHSGDQIVEVLIDVAREYAFVGQLGVFVGDNVESNDVAWREILKVLHPNRDPKASRSRCLGHIINLAAKAFLFGKNVDAFEAVVDRVDDGVLDNFETMRATQSEWRAKGPLGKVYNIVIFILCAAWCLRKQAVGFA